jgi:hypothetical protein
MANPVATRLGKNQLWYKLWYANKNYSLFLKKINTFEYLLTNYLKHGLFHQNNFFHHNFWYKSEKKSLKTPTHLYFRKYFYSHQTLRIEHSYFIRLTTPEFLPLKLYVMRYKNWIVTSVNWFKSFKKPSLRHTRSKTSPKNLVIHTSNKKTGFFIKRVRILLHILQNLNLTNRIKTTYTF